MQCVQLEREGERLEEPDGAAATDKPLAGPAYSRFHTPFIAHFHIECAHSTLNITHWLLSVSHSVHCTFSHCTQHTEHRTLAIQVSQQCTLQGEHIDIQWVSQCTEHRALPTLGFNANKYMVRTQMHTGSDQTILAFRFAANFQTSIIIHLFRPF